MIIAMKDLLVIIWKPERYFYLESILFPLPLSCFLSLPFTLTQLTLQATDADGEIQGGGKVFYSLEEGNTQDEAFFMEPESGELTIQRPLTHLDTPTSTYTLTVRATDAGIF